jgi:hypothetical protein
MAYTKEHHVILVKRNLWDVFINNFIQENRHHRIIWKDVKLFPYKTEMQSHHRGLNHQKKWNCLHTKPKWNKSFGGGNKDTRNGFCGPFLRILEENPVDLQRIRYAYFHLNCTLTSRLNVCDIEIELRQVINRIKSRRNAELRLLVKPTFIEDSMNDKCCLHIVEEQFFLLVPRRPMCAETRGSIPVWRERGLIAYSKCNALCSQLPPSLPNCA